MAAGDAVTIRGAAQTPNNVLLVVDDEELNRRVLQTALEGEGFLVELAVDGPTALAAVQSRRFAGILLDIEMPVMSGLEAARRIREVPGCRGIPIIAVSGDVSAPRLTEFKEAGIQYHLAKPFRREKLVEAVRAAVGARPGGGADWAEENAALEELRELLGPEAVAEGAQRLRELLLALASASSNDKDEVARYAHALVSQSALLGFRELSRRCKDLENACRAGGNASSAQKVANREAEAVLERLSLLYPPA